MDGAPVPAADHDTLETHIEQLGSSGAVEVVVLKRGHRGATIVRDGEWLDVPGFAVEAINTVGAGDAFASGLIRGRLAGWDW